MTAIACWINREVGGNEKVRVWIIGDSRITNYNHLLQEPKTLVESAIKIFSLPVICKKPSPTENPESGTGGYSLGIGMTIMGRSNLQEDKTSGIFFTDIYFSHTIGMAYAGNSLVGTNLYLSLMAVTSNLSSIGGYIPSILEVAHVAKDLAKLQCEEFFHNTFSPIGIEFSLTGFCKKKCKFQLIYIKVQKNCIDKTDIEIIDFSDESDDFYLLLGDKKNELSENIEKLRNACNLKDINWWRAPCDAVRGAIEYQNHNTIGGYLQAGLGHENGFNLIGWCRGFQGITFLNFQSGIPVGECFFNIPGLT